MLGACSPFQYIHLQKIMHGAQRELDKAKVASPSTANVSDANSRLGNVTAPRTQLLSAGKGKPILLHLAGSFNLAVVDAPSSPLPLFRNLDDVQQA